jgi:hypothetical protein
MSALHEKRAYLDRESSSRAVALDFALFGGAAVGDIIGTHGVELKK